MDLCVHLFFFRIQRNTNIIKLNIIIQLKNTIFNYLMLRRSVRFRTASSGIVAGSSRVGLSRAGSAQRGRFRWARVRRSYGSGTSAASTRRRVGRIFPVLRLIARLIRFLVRGRGKDRSSGRTSAQAGALWSGQCRTRWSMSSGTPWRRVRQ